MKILKPQTVENSELVEQTFNFWFNDNDHIRSPFPEYIRPMLQEQATEKFFEWASSINDKAKDEVNDEIIGEKFEEIIFETALSMVLTEDEKITVTYPFLPRIGDPINENDELSTVYDRAVVKDGDHVFLSVTFEKETSGEKWKTKFELPN